MLKVARSVSIVAAAVIAIFPSALPSAEGKALQQTPTSLTVSNPSGMDVYVVITTLTGGLTPSINNIQVNGISNWAKPSGPPPPTDSGLYYTCPPSTGGCANPPVQGFFFLQKGAQMTITST